MAQPLKPTRSGFILARLITSVLGLGLAPLFPGTVASFAATALLYFIQPAHIFLWSGILLATLLTVWLTPLIESKKGRDPGEIVMDEWAGQWMAFILTGHDSVMILLSGFLLFRIFDILKPLGINRLQQLPGGYGVVADDLLAGFYTAIILWVLSYGGLLT
ncbi:MAG: phosphatidylglycerophosphatase A [Calditrichaeota bacterium]|nr:MAG: phosphatidylglycerophosphatase A [Calditrichota bacterium]